jgi:hypothetical protein
MNTKLVVKSPRPNDRGPGAGAILAVAMLSAVATIVAAMVLA